MEMKPKIKKIKNKYKMTVLWVNIFRIACTFCAQNANTEYQWVP